MTWTETMLACWREGGVRLVAYVPDEILVPLIREAEADSHFVTLTATREEEAIGIACGASLGGMPGIVMMQSSGFGNSVNALATLAVPYQLPLLLLISERGVLGEFNPVQVPLRRALRPALDALGIVHVTLERADELETRVRRTIAQALLTQAPAALILSPLLTGGKDDLFAGRATPSRDREQAPPGARP